MKPIKIIISAMVVALFIACNGNETAKNLNSQNKELNLAKAKAMVKEYGVRGIPDLVKPVAKSDKYESSGWTKTDLERTLISLKAQESTKESKIGWKMHDFFDSKHRTEQEIKAFYKKIDSEFGTDYYNFMFRKLEGYQTRITVQGDEKIVEFGPAYNKKKLVTKYDPEKEKAEWEKLRAEHPEYFQK